jgi:hypothetical protein
MTALGFDVLFGKERHAFFDSLAGTEDFNEGRLQPSNRELSEKEREEYSTLANESVKHFNLFLTEHCNQYSPSAERNLCLVNASNEWLDTKGKKYENIPSPYISANDLAKAFIEKENKR